MADIKVIEESKNKLGEVPVWDVDEQALYWVDIEGCLLQRLNADGTITRWEMPERPCSFAVREGGGLLVALASTLAFFDTTTGKLEKLPPPEAGLDRNRFNDGKCDRRGRFWVGTMDDRLEDRTGGLFRVDPDGSVHQMDDGIGISNSLAWSPDDKTFYFADTMQRKIFAYDFDIDAGQISNKRVFTDMSDQPGNPDGSTIDAEGYLWNAQWDGWRLVRYAPDGSVDRTIDMPISKPASCIFGGPDLRTLYVTSAIWDLTPDKLKDEPLAGALFAVDVGVPGLPETRFAG